jgi:hypothetical protein
MSTLRLTLAAAIAAPALLLAPGIGSVAGAGTACAIPPPSISQFDPACSRYPDTDNDGVYDFRDNCQGYFNPSQLDTDKDSPAQPYLPTLIVPLDPMKGGDACDVDDDGDSILDVKDNCPKVANDKQTDADRDGLGDACDPDTANPNVALTAAQRKRPRLKVTGLPRKLHVAELRAGIAVEATCSKACALTAELRATPSTVRRMDLSSAVIGAASAGLTDAGMTFVFVQLAPGTLHLIARDGTARATLRLIASDTLGQHAVVRRKLALMR